MNIPSVSYKDLDLVKKIGHGQYPVFKATMAGKAIAVKKMNCDKNEIPYEVEIHSNLPPHPNVLPLLGVAHSKDGFTAYVCTQLADMSLYHYLHKEKIKPSLQQGAKWALQIANGMRHLHQHKLAHRDLKSANVLLFEKDDVTKVCDFGCARELEHTTTLSETRGTHRWMAPEFNHKANAKISQRCDVFSYGMILYEIFAHEIPFYDVEEDVNVSISIQDGKRPTVPSEVPPYIRMLMQHCWKHNPHQRPTFKEILQVLITTPTSIEETQDILLGLTPLHKAAMSGDTDAVQKLVKDDVDVNSSTIDGKTALHIASQEGHSSVVQVLIGAHADVDLLDKDGITSLYVASEDGQTEVVDILLKNKADPNTATTISPKSVPLGAAAFNGHTSTVWKLLEGGANIKAKDENGITPLDIASGRGHTEVVDVLLKHGADPNLPSPDFPHSVPLERAAKNGHIKTVEKLLEGNAYVNHQNKNGRTALFYASSNGHADVVQLLLQKHADIGICDEYGHGPLFAASEEGHTKVVSILLESGANPNLPITTFPHTVPLAVAAQKGHIQIVEKLLEGGANINCQDKNGITALYLSSKEGHLEVVRLLLKSGALDLHSEDNKAALYISSRKGHLKVVQLLLQSGTPIDKKAVAVAIDVARERQDTDVFKLLQQYSYSH